MFSRLVNPLGLFGRSSYSAMSASASPGPMELSIRQKLTALLQPTSITIKNNSQKHTHHAAMQERDGNNGETHFSIRIVSDVFKGKSPIQRHRMINSALSEEFAQGLHALSLETRTDDEAATLGRSDPSHASEAPNVV